MTLKSSEIKNFLSWWISTILKYFLVSSAFCLCTRPLFIRPMLRSFKIVPKMIFNLENSITPSSSRSRLPWRRRVLSCFDTGWSMTNNLVVQYRSKFFPQWVQFLWMNWQKYVFAFLFLPLIGSQKQIHSFLKAQSSNCISDVSCSLSSCSLFLNSVTNLFKPWEILTQEWELSLFINSIIISTPFLPCK